MTPRWIVLVAVAACAPPPSPPVHAHTKVQPAVGTPAIALAPRPIVIVPQLPAPPGVEPYWPPLGIVPALEPALRLTELFGTSGPWQSLCDERPRPRAADADELIDYTLAWCRIGQDPDALDGLVQLLHARSRRIALAVRDDLAIVLATQLHAEAALRWLDRHQLGDLVDRETLIALYHELGHDQDARVLLAPPALGTVLTEGEQNIACRHALEAATFVEPAQRRSLLNSVRWYKGWLCKAVEMMVTCDLANGFLPAIVTQCPQRHCMSYLEPGASSCRRFVDSDLPFEAIKLASAYEFWPGAESTSTEWAFYADAATTAVRAIGDEQLALVALENAVLISPCTAGEIERVHVIAEHLAHAAPHVPVEVTARIDALRTLTAEQCRERQRVAS